MPNKKFLVISLWFIVLISILFPSSLYAAKSSYYDFGPYYNQSSVLGFSFSVLENLPAPQIPDNLIPPKAGGILPDSPFAFLDKVAENVQLAFTFDPTKKEELRWEQAVERLQEVKTLIDQAKTEAALRAASNYRETLSTLTENLDKLPADVVNKIEEGAAAHEVLSQGLSFSASPAVAEAWNLSLEASRQVLDKVADVKGEAALPEDLSTGIQALKQQGLISEEESNKIYGFKSRAEVREELEKLALSGQFPLSEMAKLDEGVNAYYPDIQKQNLANLQVAELKSYQGLQQPSEETIGELNRWQQNQGVTPPNNIKPYLWYNRAQDLVVDVDLSNFSPDQQREVAKFYPSIASNKTYTPPESGVAGPTPSPSPAPEGEPAAPESLPSPLPSPIPVNYIRETGGALPGDAGYFFKQFGETLSLTFTVSEAEKARLNMEFAERRLAEAQSLAGDPKKTSQYADALQRYHDAVLDATLYIEGISDERVAKDAAERLESQAARHEIALEKGILPPPAQKPELISNAIKATEDAMDQAADTLDKPALPLALASRLDDLKAQGLVLPEEAEDLVNSETRKEVREKIRKLTELGSFPPADAKKLDEAQGLISTSDYNQLVEVRKVEELQGLRAVQTQLAQTPTLLATNDSLSAREQTLYQTVDTSLIRLEDLEGREDLKNFYQTLQATSSARPINRGQFGNQPPPPAKPDAVLSVCPEGAIFKKAEGCVWEDSGKKINGYDQYRCGEAGYYYSFPVQKCVPNQPGKGFGDDSKPVCPVGYAWFWGSQSCQKSARERVDPKYSCPDFQYFQYYSPNEGKCVPIPDPGDPFPSVCSEQGTYWSFSEQKCIAWPEEKEGKYKNLAVPQPVFMTPDNPFYPVKGWGEFFQRTFSFTPERRQAVTLDQAKERLAEAAYALKKQDKEGVKQAISAYTATMQNLVADVSKEALNSQAKLEISKMLSEESVEQNLLLSKLSTWADEEQDAVLSAATSVTILGIDKASDISGEPPIPDDVKAKIESLPKEMISDEDKKKLLETDSRVGVRVELNKLLALGGLAEEDAGFLYKGFQDVDAGTSVEIEELKKLAEIADITKQKQELDEKVKENEDIATKMDEFQKNFEPGKEIDPEVRPYVRLTRIEEVAQTVRPDVVNLSDFQNRKDVILAVATLQQEFKPTRESFRQVEDFRRRNPGGGLPPELARIEALAYSLGVRNEAGSCFLPTPPFPVNTPCPAPGAAIQITSYYNSYNSSSNTIPIPYQTTAVDKDGKPYSYGQGPQSTSAGICPDGYHWMYDGGGWCMSNSGSYSPTYNTSPSGTGSGYTPYSPYYTAPGAPPGTYGTNDSNFINRYSPPSYWGPAPTSYTTNPPSGTVPGSGPRPNAQGTCPTGFHWMSDSGGWCMADGGTYVPAGGNYNSYPYSPNLNQSSCGPGYYWNGNGCVRTSPSDTYGSCNPPPAGCGSSSYWDYGSCSCRGSSSTSFYGGGGYSSNNSCQGISCGGGSYLDYSTCSCRYPSSPGSPGYPGSPNPSCSPPAGGCGSGWWDSGSCSCKQASSQGCYNVSASSCGSGFYWDAGACTCRSNTSTPSTPPSGGGSTSSGSCPSGYHWMSDSGGWCMSDGGGGSGGGSSPAPSSSPASSSEPAPSSSPASSPSSGEPAPAPSASTSTEPPPSSGPSPSP